MLKKLLSLFLVKTAKPFNFYNVFGIKTTRNQLNKQINQKELNRRKYEQEKKILSVINMGRDKMDRLKSLKTIDFDSKSENHVKLYEF